MSIWDKLVESDVLFQGTSCWVWQSYVHEKGYGRTTYRGRPVKVHRLAWVLLRGDIPEGLSIDHLCENKLCCNPWHMDLVPSSLNAKRKFDRANAVMGYCIRGHKNSPENTYVSPSGRGVCLPCKRMHRKAEYARKKASQTV